VTGYVLPLRPTAEHKLTVGTNRPAPSLVALFEDVLACSPAAAGISRTTAANVMSFQLHSGGVGVPALALALELVPAPALACAAPAAELRARRAAAAGGHYPGVKERRALQAAVRPLRGAVAAGAGAAGASGGA
jgi:hypothetical protein